MPGDKSISFRTLIISSQLIGVTHLRGVLEGDDIKCCIQCLKDLVKSQKWMKINVMSIIT